MGNSFNTGRLINGLFVDASGNVGIGTTTPAEKLSVIGNIRLDNGTADGGQLVLASSGFSDWNLDNFSGNFRWYYGATERMRLTNGGVLGIGVTPASQNAGAYGGSAEFGGIIRIQGSGGRYFTSGNGLEMSYNSIYSYNRGTNAYNDLGINDAITVKGAGNVGIGTSSPWGKFNVVDGTNKSFVVQDAGIADTIELTNYSSGGGLRNISLTASTLIFNTGNAGGGTATERMRITSGGQLQVRQDALFGLDFNSTQYIAISENQIRRLGNAILFINNSNTGDVSININGGGTFVNGTNGYGRAVTNSSDIRIKKNISSIDNALNKVLQMNGVYYEFNNENELGINVPSGNTRIGLIAQDIENILPEAVLTPLEENQPKSIDYSGMIGLLINAIQELNAKLTALENK